MRRLRFLHVTTLSGLMMGLLLSCGSVGQAAAQQQEQVIDERPRLNYDRIFARSWPTVLRSNLGPESREFEGIFFESYKIVIERPGRVYVGLESSVFDTYLYAISPSGEISGNDDAGSMRRSLLQIVPREFGEWHIVVTSYGGRGRGSYVLRADPEHSIVPDRDFDIAEELLYRRSATMRYDSILLRESLRSYDDFEERKWGRMLEIELLELRMSLVEAMERVESLSDERGEDSNRLHQLMDVLFGLDLPWPPPQASASTAVPMKHLSASTDSTRLLIDVYTKLHQSLQTKGYSVKSYRAPGGFAMVTNIEQFLDGGKSREGPYRRSLEVPPLRDPNWKEYVKALLFGRDARFRFFLFVVTTQEHGTDPPFESITEARGLVDDGTVQLRETDLQTDPKGEYVCEVYIYEFWKKETDEDGNFLENGSLDGDTHLLESGIKEALGYE